MEVEYGGRLMPILDLDANPDPDPDINLHPGTLDPD